LFNTVGAAPAKSAQATVHSTMVVLRRRRPDLSISPRTAPAATAAVSEHDSPYLAMSDGDLLWQSPSRSGVPRVDCGTARAAHPGAAGGVSAVPRPVIAGKSDDRAPWLRTLLFGAFRGADPAAEGLVIDTELTAHVAQRSARRPDEIDRVPTEILGILRRAGHPDILPPDHCLVSRCPIRRWSFRHRSSRCHRGDRTAGQAGLRSIPRMSI
jgi:hypothetical protein